MSRCHIRQAAQPKKLIKIDVGCHSGHRPKATLLRCGVHVSIAAALAIASEAVLAQTPTPDPASWRPLSYADLQRPVPATQTYADLWKDVIERNNRAYQDRGDHRFAGTNAPVTEAHYVIWSPSKSVVLSVLDTATLCTLREVKTSISATVKMCPMRLAIYEGVVVHTLDGGQACYLERSAAAAGAPDAGLAAAYASYDPATRTIKTGLVVDHRPVEGCSQAIPLPAS